MLNDVFLLSAGVVIGRTSNPVTQRPRTRAPCVVESKRLSASKERTRCGRDRRAVWLISLDDCSSIKRSGSAPWIANSPAVFDLQEPLERRHCKERLSREEEARWESAFHLRTETALRQRHWNAEASCMALNAWVTDEIRLCQSRRPKRWIALISVTDNRPKGNFCAVHCNTAAFTALDST